MSPERKYGEEVWLEMWRLRVLHPDWGRSRMYNALRESLGKGCPSQQRVAQILAKMPSIESEQGRNELPWQWSESDGIGLPSEAAAFILDVQFLMRRLDLFPESEFPQFRESFLIGGQRVSIKGAPWPVPPLTRREAHWLWRIHSTAAELDAHDAFWLTQRCVTRERAHFLMSPASGETANYADIEGLLVFKPWRGDEELNMYFNAVQRGDIPPIESGSVAAMRAIAAQTSRVGVSSDTSDGPVTFTRLPGDYSSDFLRVPFHSVHMERIRQESLGR
jgi:hypothetical protein